MNGGGLVILLCGIGALLSSIVSNFWCRTITFKPAEYYGVSTGLPDVSYGLWTQRDIEFFDSNGENGDQTTLSSKNTCKLYPKSVHVDSTWKLARACSIIAPSFGAFLVASATFGNNSPRKWWNIAVALLVLVTLCQGLTLLLFRSSACNTIPLLNQVESNQLYEYMISLAYPGNCQLDSGSVATIVATLLWFLTGLSMIVFGAPKQEDIEGTKYTNFDA